MALGSDQKRQLHDLIDRLPAGQVAALLTYAQHMHSDPLALSLLNAPPDDEPYTDIQREQDLEAIAAIQRGEGIPHEEILREFGL